jgi:hypothetical protein
MGKRRSGHRDFVGKIKGKGLLGRPRLGGNIFELSHPRCVYSIQNHKIY